MVVEIRNRGGCGGVPMSGTLIATWPFLCAVLSSNRVHCFLHDPSPRNTHKRPGHQPWAQPLPPPFPPPCSGRDRPDNSHASSHGRTSIRPKPSDWRPSLLNDYVMLKHCSKCWCIRERKKRDIVYFLYFFCLFCTEPLKRHVKTFTFRVHT